MMLDPSINFYETQQEFESYWQNNFPKFDKVHITYYGDGASMMAALEADEVDLVFRPPYEEVARFKKLAGLIK